jgi:hypothetical protein
LEKLTDPKSSTLLERHLSMTRESLRYASHPGTNLVNRVSLASLASSVNSVNSVSFASRVSLVSGPLEQSHPDEQIVLRRMLLSRISAKTVMAGIDTRSRTG